jgi:hemolysin activation/secretion protein
VRDPITAVDRYTLVGSGVGLRLKAWGGVTAAFDWAIAMNDIGKTKTGDSRAYFKLAYQW